MMEPIRMLELRRRLFPACFDWRGQVYNVEAVNECQTEITPAGRSTAYHFWVRVGGRLMHLRQVLSSGKWMLQLENERR